MAAEVATAPVLADAPAAPAPAARPAPANPAATAAPSKTSALYVGDLNADVSETKLFEIFNAVAPVSSIRVCRDAITRESLGYAYVNFSSAADAERALNELAYAPINGRPCRVMWSQRDPTVRRNNAGNVFVKNLGPEITSKELYESFKPFGTILSCKVAMDNKGVSKGYGFVHFEGDSEAKHAIDVVDGMSWNGRTVQVAPYIPRQQRSGPEWTNVYVKNIPKGWTQKNLEELFATCGEIASCIIMTDTATGASKGYGFVCYRTHAGAAKAAETLNGKEVEGTPATLPPTKGESSGAAAADDKPRPMKLFVGRAQKKAERERLLREKVDAAKRERQTKWAGCNLYVRNLDESVDDEALRREFTPFGAITSARVERDKEGRSRLFGYVCYSTPEEASKAIATMHHKIVQGKPLYVQLWQPKEQREATMASARSNVAARPGATQAGAATGINPLAAATAAGVNPMAALYNPAGIAAMFQMMQRGGAGAPVSPDMATQITQLQQFYLQIMAQQQRMMAQGARGAAGAPGAGPMAGTARPGAAPGAPGAAPNAAAFNPAALLLGAQFNPLMAQQLAAAAAAATGATGAPATSPGAAAARGGRRGAPGATAGAPAGQRVAGPARGAAPAAAPAATGAAARPAPATGAVPARTAPAAGARPAGGMQYRNAAAAGLADAAPSAAVPAPVAAAPPAVATGTDFLAQIMAAPDEQRKTIIGEALYQKIMAREPARAGKITGMLLEGMDVTELIHLLEAQTELDASIQEAVAVLDAHSGTRA